MVFSDHVPSGRDSRLGIGGCAMITPLRAVLDLIFDAQQDRNTITGYNRVRRSLRALGLTEPEIVQVLSHLNYHDMLGLPRQWVTDALAAKAAKQ